jgi:hypothetical protein
MSVTRGSNLLSHVRRPRFAGILTLLGIAALSAASLPAADPVAEQPLPVADAAKPEEVKKAEPVGVVDGLLEGINETLGAEVDVNAAVMEAQVDGQVVIDQNNPDPMVQQMQPFLQQQLRFLKMAAEIPAEARPKIKKDAEVALRVYAKRINDQNNGMVQRQEDSQALFWDKIKESLTTHLPPEMAAQALKEIDEKRNYEVKAARLIGIGAIDQQLLLTAEQRTKIEEGMIANWKPEYIYWSNLRFYGGQYVPQIQDETLITKHLSDQQKKIWQSLQKISIGDFGWQMNNGEMLQQDVWWDGAGSTQDGFTNLLDGVLE